MYRITNKWFISQKLPLTFLNQVLLLVLILIDMWYLARSKFDFLCIILVKIYFYTVSSSTQISSSETLWTYYSRKQYLISASTIQTLWFCKRKTMILLGFVGNSNNFDLKHNKVSYVGPEQFTLWMWNTECFYNFKVGI